MTTDLDLLIAAGVRRSYAERLLENVGAGKNLSTLTAAELSSAGVPASTAYRVAAAIELGRRACVGAEPEALNEARDVWRMIRPLVAGVDQERFYVLPVNVRNGLIGGAAGIVEVARGTVHGVEVYPREVFRVGIRAGAAGLVLAHNHPSGDPTPSHEDVELTRRLKAAGELVGIPIIDHVVVCADSFRSIAEWMGDAL